MSALDPLPDPLGDRPMPKVPAPPRGNMPHNVLWPNEKGGDPGKPDFETLRKHLHLEGRLSVEDIILLCRQTKAVLSKEPNLVKVKDPVVIVGDIHGQYYDMLKMLDMGGSPEDVQYLFLGDYVDRGSFGCEVVFLVFALKLNYPNRVWTLRGNHESRQMTEFFNFKSECEHKYSLTVYEEIMEIFDALPVCGLVNGKFLCVHGCIGPEFQSLDSIQSMHRFVEPPREGLMCDLLWADPAVDKKEKDKTSSGGFQSNQVRGCSYFVSYKAVCDFLARTGLLSVVRAHEVQNEGYKMHRDNAKTGFPSVITVFSAPNYCDVYNNKAAVLKFTNNTLNILQYHFSKHPYHLPTFMSLFEWSLPFVSEKVVETLQSLLEQADAGDEEEVPEDGDLPPLMKTTFRKSLSAKQNEAVALAARMSVMEAEKSQSVRSDHIKSKIRTVGRMQRMLKAVREAHQAHVQLNGITPGDRINVQNLRTALDSDPSFKKIKKLDRENEMMPGLVQAPYESDVSGDEELSAHHGRPGQPVPYEAN